MDGRAVALDVGEKTTDTAPKLKTGEPDQAPRMVETPSIPTFGMDTNAFVELAGGANETAEPGKESWPPVGDAGEPLGPLPATGAERLTSRT